MTKQDHTPIIVFGKGSHIDKDLDEACDGHMQSNFLSVFFYFHIKPTFYCQKNFFS